MTALRLPDISRDEAAIVQANAHMPRGDPEFCLWVLKQLSTVGIYHMAEPFDNLIGRVSIDISRLKQNIINGTYANAAEFESEFKNFVDECRTAFTKGSKEEQKACELTLKLFELFKGRGRFDGRRAKKQAADAAATNSQTEHPDTGHGRTGTLAAGMNRTHHSSLAIRTPTPGPSGKTNNRFGGRTDQAQRSNAECSLRADLENAFMGGDDDSIFQGSEEAPEHKATLQSARFGKRAASPPDDGARPKQARQDTKMFDYRDLRVSMAEMVDVEMDSVNRREPGVKLTEDAHLYLDHLAREDTAEQKKNKRDIKNEIKENCRVEGEELLLDFVHRKINDFLTSKGRGLPRRMSLSTKMEDIRSGPPTYAAIEGEREKQSRR